MPRVGREDVLEVATAEDEEPVEAFATGAADPALGVRPRLRCAHRRLDHANAFGAEDLVELAGELAVAVTDQKPWTTNTVLVEPHQHIGRLLIHLAAVRVGRGTYQWVATGC